MAATLCLFTLLSQDRGMWASGRLEGEQITTVKKRQKAKKMTKKQKKKIHVQVGRRKHTEKIDSK